MTNRQRMLAAYRRQQPDQAPVSPELWYDMGLLLTKDCTVEDFCFGRYPLWKLQRSAHRFFGSAAWLCAGPGGGAVNGEIRTEHYYTSAGEWSSTTSDDAPGERSNGGFAPVGLFTTG